MNIIAQNIDFKELNKVIRDTKSTNITIEACLEQRYIASGLKEKNITIYGTAGNALGSYLNGSTIRVFGNAQEATGDTMNTGAIYIHGSCGDAAGYAMRGGKIFVRDNTGYRAGIHIKAYKDHKPVLVIGGQAGSFLGEYQAGGIIIVLGLYNDTKPPVGRFCGTGMHGGKMFIRCDKLPFDLPKQVVASKADEQDMQEIHLILKEFCTEFQLNLNDILNKQFYVLKPDTKNPYKQLYTIN